MAEVKLYSAIINEAGEQAWAVLEADYARLSELKDTLVEALKMMVAQGGPLGSYGNAAFDKAYAALSAAALFEQEKNQ